MIPEYLNPIDKLKCLATVSSSIVESINKFWKGITVIDKEKLTINGDSMLMIYIFITIKARQNVSDLFAQIKFMNEFSTSTIKNTKLGYCMTTLEIALNHILMLSKDQFDTDSKDELGSGDGSCLWSESRKSITRSLRESLSQSIRSNSLVIKDDPFGEVFKYTEEGGIVQRERSGKNKRQQ